MGIFPNLAIFIEISRLSFSMFTVVFLGIVIWQAWQMVAPAKIEKTSPKPQEHKDENAEAGQNATGFDRYAQKGRY